MTDFAIPERYDETAANEGVWFVIDDENGNEYGSFKCRLIDQFSNRAELERKRIIQKYNLKDQRASKKMTDEDRMRIVLCESSLVDWEMKDAKGKKVPFSVEKALEYFSLDATKFVFVELLKIVGDVTNFPVEAEIEVEAEEVEKTDRDRRMAV